MKQPRFLRVISAALACTLAVTLSAAEPLRYNRDVRPILSDNCFACHGPDKAKRDSGLRLDLREEATKPAESGDTAIVPGKPERSELIARIFSEDRDEKMPPPKAHKTLTPPQKETLKRWIAEGAEYEAHWAFAPLARLELPAVRNAAWPRNGVDRFILARLEKEGLAPSPEADAATLIRRLSLDLTGLPPTPEEVEAFIDESHATYESHGSYERQLDRLLASPHFGERMAVDWLDAARYADSNGYQIDRDREMHAWRDWVIRAFNRNQPFDQFTIEQLAGDLLPGATLEQRIATGFHRNHMLNEEGGIIKAEFLAEYTADRVETTATVWLGQTFNCARCHDHKFDPFTQRDFYSFKAFFHNVPELAAGNDNLDVRRNLPPFLKLPAPKIEARVAALEAQLAAANQARASLAVQSAPEIEAWASRLAATELAWTDAPILTARAGPVTREVKAADGALQLGPLQVADHNITFTARLPGPRVTTLRLVCAAAEAGGLFQWGEVTAALVGADGKKRLVPLRAAEAGGSLAAKEIATTLDRDRRTVVRLMATPEQSAEAVFELENALHLAEGEPAELEIKLTSEMAVGATAWRLAVGEAEPELLAPAAIVVVARKDAAARTAAERKQLAAFRVSRLPAHRELTTRIAGLTQQIKSADAETPTAAVMEEMPEPRPTFILVRGAYDKPGEPVTAATPAVLLPMAADLPRNRLGLARWLVDPRNPLPARVTVNRLWQMIFGTGLVRTSDDFGAQGEAPSHPELLDWLAGEFIRSGWDVKAMMRLLVTSATYRQSSRLTPALRERDPENRLLTRGARFRLPAEMVRDQALAVSGLLVPVIGGPSVRPYHPPGLYEQVVATRSASGYVQGKGDDLHRRSLYTYWKRSVPHPAMLAFDAPFREACTLRRPRTNTPLQALNLMNDPTYVEAARLLAQRMMREGGTDAEARLAHGFRLVLARPPRAPELAVLTRAYERALREFQTDPAGVQDLLQVGEARHDAKLDAVELAALTTVASTLLCTDATITKE